MRVTTERANELADRSKVGYEKGDLAADLLKARKLLREINKLAGRSQRDWNQLSQDSHDICELIGEYFLLEGS